MADWVDRSLAETEAAYVAAANGSDGHVPALQFFPKIAHPRKLALLGAYLSVGALNKACAAIKMDHSHHYYWLRNDPDYAEAFEDAKRMVAITMEEEAIRRARDGIQRDVYHQGEVVGQQTVYSDVLLIFLLKGMMPEKYGNARADREDKQSISDLLKAVLLEMSAREQAKNVTPEAQWTPLSAQSGQLPAPPAPEEP